MVQAEESHSAKEKQWGCLLLSDHTFRIFLHFGNFFFSWQELPACSPLSVTMKYTILFSVILTFLRLSVVVVSSPCCATLVEQNLNPTQLCFIRLKLLNYTSTRSHIHILIYTRAHISNATGYENRISDLCLLSETSSERQELEVDKDHNYSFKTFWSPKQTVY